MEEIAVLARVLTAPRNRAGMAPASTAPILVYPMTAEKLQVLPRYLASRTAPDIFGI